MPTVEITGWRVGLQKIPVTRALQEHAGLDLAAAKAITDRVLRGESVSVSLFSQSQADALAELLRSLGAECTAKDHEPAS